MQEEKTKHREGKEYRDLVNRLSRIEGQVRGVKKMVEEDRYCIDILVQVQAIQAALNGFNKTLLSEHIHSCVVKDIQEGNVECVNELCETIKKLMDKRDTISYRDGGVRRTPPFVLTVCAFSDRSSPVFSLRTAGRIVEFRVESIEVFAVEPVGHDS